MYWKRSVLRSNSVLKKQPHSGIGYNIDPVYGNVLTKLEIFSCRHQKLSDMWLSTLGFIKKIALQSKVWARGVGGGGGGGG